MFAFFVDIGRVRVNIFFIDFICQGRIQGGPKGRKLKTVLKMKQNHEEIIIIRSFHIFLLIFTSGAVSDCGPGHQ